MTIDSGQFGTKVGRHAQDYGLSPADPAARAWIRSHIESIRRAPDEVRQGAYHPKGGGTENYWFYRQGSDVVITQGDGAFVTLLKDGQTNRWFREATRR